MKFNKLRTRRGKLEQKISIELNKPKPNIQVILSAVDSFEKDNLDTITKLRKEKLYEARKISGALKSTIDAHGPITKVLIGSATKRIYGSLLGNSKPAKEDEFYIIHTIFKIFAVLGLVYFTIMFLKSIYGI